MSDIALKYRPLSEISDWEILCLMNNKHQDPINYELACWEFFHRYKSFLLQVCKKGCSGFDSVEQLAGDIFQNTMIKVCEKSDKFKLKNPQDKTNISGHIKSWLTIIARNELREFLRKNPDEKALSNKFRIKSYEVEDYIVDSTSQENAHEPPTIQKTYLECALATLSERESHILRIYMEYFDPAQPKRHLPDEILNALCSKYNITIDNIRQIKGRAMKKIKESIENQSKMN